MTAETFLIGRAEEIENPIGNWGVGYTAQVLNEYASLKVKEATKNCGTCINSFKQ